MFLLYLVFHMSFLQPQMEKVRNELFLHALLNLQEKKWGSQEKNRKSLAMKKADITTHLKNHSIVFLNFSSLYWLMVLKTESNFLTPRIFQPSEILFPRLWC